MIGLRQMNNSGFDAPSSPSGGAKGKLVLKITGIGCLIFLLIGGLLSGLGVFKAVTCCSEFESVHTANYELGHGFANSLHRGDYGAAYQLLDDDLRSQKSLQQFEAELSPWADGFGASSPFPLQIRIDESTEMRSIGDSSRWHLTTRYAGIGSEEVLELRMVTQFGKDEAGEVVGAIVEWDISTHRRALGDDPSAQAATRFYDRIRRGDITAASHMVTIGSPMMAEDGDGFEEIARALRAQTAGTRTWIVGVYPEQEVLVGVVMVFDGGDEQVQAVDFLVRDESQIHMISEIRPVTAEEVGLHQEQQNDDNVGQAIEEEVAGPDDGIEGGSVDEQESAIEDGPNGGEDD